MKKLLLLSGIVLLSGMSASANILVNGGFDSAVTLWETKFVDPDGMQAPNTGVNAIDAGWVAQGSSTAATWDTVGGLGTRSATVTTSGSYGIAQFVSNPGDSTFDNGDTVTISFDYEIGGSRNIGFNYRLFGIDTTYGGAWAGSAGIALNLPLDANVPGVANGYTYYQLDNIAPILTAVAGGSYTADIVLTNQYEHFAVVFWTDLDGGSVTIDNVDLSSAGGVAPPSSFSITSFDVQDDVSGIISTVGFDGDIGPTYTLQTQSDLLNTNWANVATGTVSPLVYTNGISTNAAFFRIQTQ